MLAPAIADLDGETAEAGKQRAQIEQPLPERDLKRR
jgi:hypothetical protein